MGVWLTPTSPLHIVGGGCRSFSEGRRRGTSSALKLDDEKDEERKFQESGAGCVPLHPFGVRSRTKAVLSYCSTHTMWGGEAARALCLRIIRRRQILLAQTDLDLVRIIDLTQSLVAEELGEVRRLAEVAIDRGVTHIGDDIERP